MGLMPIIVKVKMRDITQNEKNDSKYYLLCYPMQKFTWESMMLELLTFREADKNLPNDMLMKHLPLTPITNLSNNFQGMNCLHFKENSKHR